MQAQALHSIYGEEIYDIPDKVVIALPVAWNEAAAEDRAQLSRILSFAKLSLDKVRIVSTNTLSDVSRCAVVIAFGITAKGLEPYTVYDTPGRTTLLSEPLKKLSAEPRAKQQLAACLKQVFKL
jgi:hypothetical protein